MVAIAPGCYIDRDLCHDVKHYLTRGDLVTYLDMWGRVKYREDVVVLDSHKWHGLGDHAFQSTTYEQVIIDRTKGYIKQHGVLR